MSRRPSIRAAYIQQLGSPETIQYGDLPAPRPGPTDVIVEVAVTPVNRVDTFVRSGAYRTPLPFPFVVGRDVVGVVAELGERVTRFAVGDEVWCNSLGHDGRQGATAERVVVPEERLYHLPHGVSPELAAAIAHPAATAYLALVVHGRVHSGQVVLVTGAAGNVGSAAVVQASLAGARVIATAAPRDAHYCHGLGADEVIDYHDRDGVRGIRDVVPGGVDVYVDAAGENDLATAIDILAVRGRIVVLAGATATPQVPVGGLYMKDGSVRGFAISNATVEELAEAATAVNALLVDMRLQPRATRTYSFREVGAVHRRVEEEGLHGSRFLLRPPSEALG